VSDVGLAGCGVTGTSSAAARPERLLTTQLFINGHPGNKRDGIFRDLRDPIDRELVLVDFRPVPGSRIGELSARFDIVVGRTPEDAEGDVRRY
jgi:protocatechuate 3,4-dioxygenase beta subunit